MKLSPDLCIHVHVLPHILAHTYTKEKKKEHNSRGVEAESSNPGKSYSYSISRPVALTVQ